MLKYWVWLSELKGLRNQTKLALLRRFGDPESIFYADPDELMLTEGADPGQLKLMENHDLAPADKILADCQRLDIQLLTFSGAAYPGRLKNISDPPALLYYKGKLPLRWWGRGPTRPMALPARKSWALVWPPAEPWW